MPDPYKNNMRHILKHLRKNTSSSFRTQASQTICNKIKPLQAYRQAKRMALYFSIQGEVELDSLWKTASLQGTFCYFPAINPEGFLSFLPAHPKTLLKKNHLGILEPDVPQSEAIAPDDLDLIIIPTLGFDSQCRRLGMGGGFYDRTLHQTQKAKLLGVAYEFQRINVINTEAWDVSLHAVLTEQTMYGSL